MKMNPGWWRSPVLGRTPYTKSSALLSHTAIGRRSEAAAVTRVCAGVHHLDHLRPAQFTLAQDGDLVLVGRPFAGGLELPSQGVKVVDRCLAGPVADEELA